VSRKKPRKQASIFTMVAPYSRLDAPQGDNLGPNPLFRTPKSDPA
jgi:hypothetical protein